MSNTILIEEQSFTGTYDSSASAYYYSPNGTPFNNETIFVDLDGVIYECQTRGGDGFDNYGATFNFSTRSYDWSVYPFSIESVTYDPEEAYLLIAVSDGSEHTIAIYSELPAPVVRDYIDKVDLNGTEYDIKDTTSGYISEIVAGSNVTINLDSEGNPVIAATDTDTTYSLSAGAVSHASGTSWEIRNTLAAGGSGSGTSTGGVTLVPGTNITLTGDTSSSPNTITISASGGGSGTVTSVAVSNDTNGGLFVSGSPVTSSGTITIGHSNVLGSAQTTQAVYPIKIDKNGHISAYGSAVTIPTVNNGALKLQKNADTATSVYTANQSNDSTLKFTTTSVGSASSWSAGTMTTIDTSKFNGGSAASLSSGFYSAGTANIPTVIDTSKFSGGSFTRGSFSGGSFTQGTDSLSGSITGTGTLASPGTLSISFSQGTDSFTAATHANDSFTAASLASGFYSAGTANTPTVIDTSKFNGGSAASLSSGFYSAGTAPSLTVTSTTVVNDISKV